ncbi:hypothetical protein PG995_004367 [Apiospora arundinis]
MNLDASRLPKVRASWCSNWTPYNIRGDAEKPTENPAIEHLVKGSVVLAQPTANDLYRDAGKMLGNTDKLGDNKRRNSMDGTGWNGLIRRSKIAWLWAN